MSKVEIRTARGSTPSMPHTVAVEYLPKWGVWYIDINPVTARPRGRPQRIQSVPSLEQATLLASKIRDEILSGLTSPTSDSKV